MDVSEFIEVLEQSDKPDHRFVFISMDREISGVVLSLEWREDVLWVEYKDSRNYMYDRAFDRGDPPAYSTREVIEALRGHEGPLDIRYVNTCFGGTITKAWWHELGYLYISDDGVPEPRRDFPVVVPEASNG
jgi:hypothetical protein